MEDTSKNRENSFSGRLSKYMTVGLVAHVDAGKTTLAEAMLYQSGSIRKFGRVDHGTACLDTYELERQRGITIFSKQARLTLGDREITLLDTPGHVDFSAEMERTLQVLDCAVLVISGADGVQGHARTLWRLLKRYQVPVFLFVNKMDQTGTDRRRLLEELKEKLDEGCTDFSSDRPDEELWEELAVCHEELLEAYLKQGSLKEEQIAEQIRRRSVFPCYFGSALRLNGVEELLSGLTLFGPRRRYSSEFGARVYKISRDDQGNRLTHLKITGGSLKVKSLLKGHRDGEDWEEKVDQLRLYSGESFQAVPEVSAGMICALTGPTQTRAGDGLGFETQASNPLLEPVLTYQLLLSPDCDVHGMLAKLRRLEEELPELHVVWRDALGEIHIQVMGAVQLEILKSLILERFGETVEFGPGSIIYKETIASTVEGVGHFEPLRHYAEVHLILEPGEPGSGVVLDTSCSEDVLDRNWQRLILTHLAERKHPGVLLGAELTDVKITLAAGKAHLKHTEGGDFRQATYRAVRQGLCQAQSVLLEPFYEFRLEVPADKVGRAMADIQKMSGTFCAPGQDGETFCGQGEFDSVPRRGSPGAYTSVPGKDGQIGEISVLTGRAPVSAMGDYQSEVYAYTRGTGRLFCTPAGYGPCHNAQEVIAAAGYDPDQDAENPTGSVFCAHGAGFYVPWNQVPDYMHLESVRKAANRSASGQAFARQSMAARELADPKELEEIFVRTYGPIRRDRQGVGRVERSFHREPEQTPVRKAGPKKPEKEYLLVDGYNIIFSWEDLRELAEENMEAARGKLMDILCNLQGYRKNTVILVFDAYRVEGSKGSVSKYHNIHVVYTKEAETADQYIEKTAHELGRQYAVTVATSDALEQVIILGQGAKRMSAQGLLEEVQNVNAELRDSFLSGYSGSKQYLLENLPEELAKFMEEVRLGRKSFGED
ncbi:GTP-binding protein [bacterium 1XD21-13]|nr:GTP-binding protein [bacterium 1XD21-13]